MRTERINAFTDGVIAIVITIMVLELPTPKDSTWDALRPDVPLFVAYALSFVNVGIFWNNHHHMMSLVRHVNGRILWSNLFLLFWLSLFPFVIRWIGEDGLHALPVAAYGVVRLMSSLAYILLERTVIVSEGENGALHAALGHGTKEWISLAIQFAGIALSFVNVYAAVVCYIAIAIIWFIPDLRVERALHETDGA
nr:TMEM175 family protein [uncultured Sphingomonas sp.]